MKFLLQSLLLIASFTFIFIWQQTTLSLYTLQTIAALVVLYLLAVTIKQRAFNKPKEKKEQEDKKTGFKDLAGVFLLNTGIILLIFSTGGIYSNIFFLLYFLAFGLSFVFKPAIVFVFAIGVTLVFLEQILIGDVIGNSLRIGSVVAISPVAFFFGRQFNKKESEEQRRKEEEKLLSSNHSKR